MIGGFRWQDLCFRAGNGVQENRIGTNCMWVLWKYQYDKLVWRNSQLDMLFFRTENVRWNLLWKSCSKPPPKTKPSGEELKSVYKASGLQGVVGVIFPINLRVEKMSKLWTSFLLKSTLFRVKLVASKPHRMFIYNAKTSQWYNLR